MNQVFAQVFYSKAVILKVSPLPLTVSKTCRKSHPPPTPTRSPTWVTSALASLNDEDSTIRRTGKRGREAVVNSPLVLQSGTVSGSMLDHVHKTSWMKSGRCCMVSRGTAADCRRSWVQSLTSVVWKKVSTVSQPPGAPFLVCRSVRPRPPCFFSPIMVLCAIILYFEDQINFLIAVAVSFRAQSGRAQVESAWFTFDSMRALTTTTLPLTRF